MNDEQENQDKSSRDHKKLTRREWETVVDQQIREAMERGDFENLRGRGKPLDLSVDPNVPEDWQLAFKVLKDAGYAPDWVEQDKDLRAALENLFKPLRRYLERGANFRGDRAPYEDRLIAEFRKAAAELNRTIDVYNLKAPSPRVHRPRIRIEEEVEKFRRRCAEIK